MLRVLSAALGEEWVAKFKFVLASGNIRDEETGPIIYKTIVSRLCAPKERCVVNKDTLISMQAAVAARVHALAQLKA